MKWSTPSCRGTVFVVLLALLLGQDHLGLSAAVTGRAEAQPQAGLKKIRVLASAPPSAQCRYSATSHPNPSPVYIPGSLPPGVPVGTAIGAAVAAELVGAILEGLFSGNPEEKIARQMDSRLSHVLGDWNLARVLGASVSAVLGGTGRFESTDHDPSFVRQDIGDVVKQLAGSGLDAVVQFRATRYGLRSQPEGYAVFLETEAELVLIRTGKVIAAHQAKFDSSYAQPVEPDGVVIRTAPTAFVLPTRVVLFEQFTANGGALLRRDLKAAALIVSYESVVALGLADRATMSWRDLFRPQTRNAVVRQ